MILSTRLEKYEIKEKMFMEMLSAFAGYAVLGSILSAIFAILHIIGVWNVFKKAGEPGWKAIIPFYNTYTLYKISWSPMWFWISLMGTLLGVALLSFATVTVCVVIGAIIELVVFVVRFVAIYRLCLSFGWGVGKYILTILFAPIMLMVMGFDKSVYAGPITN